MVTSVPNSGRYRSSSGWATKATHEGSNSDGGFDFDRVTASTGQTNP